MCPVAVCMLAQHAWNTFCVQGRFKLSSCIIVRLVDPCLFLTELGVVSYSCTRCVKGNVRSKRGRRQHPHEEHAGNQETFAVFCPVLGMCKANSNFSSCQFFSLCKTEPEYYKALCTIL